MKKAVPAGLLCLLAAAFLTGPLAAQSLTYASNPIGQILGEPLEPEEAAHHPYILTVESPAGGEIRRLLDEDRRELKRWERVYSETGSLLEESAYQQGEIESRRLYLDTGLPGEELLFRDGELEGRFVFSYGQGFSSPGASAPGGVSFSRPDGSEEYQDQYLYLPSGEFRGVKRTYQDGTVYTSLFSRLEGLPWEEWHSFQGTEILFRYDRQGRLVLQQERREGELREQVDFFYSPQPPYRPTQRITRDLGTNREIRLQYDGEGRPERESLLEDGLLLAVSLFSYQDDRLVRRERRYRGGTELWEYRHDDKGDLTEEYYSRDKELKKATRHNPSPDYSRIEEFYQEGRVFLRVFYRDKLPVHRELVEGDG